MINTNRIVPVTRTDLLTLLGTMMKLAGTSVSAVEASAPGRFTVTGSGDAGNKIANEPVKSLNIASGVTAAVIYFIADDDYEGFYINGVAEVTEGVDVDPDGVTLYSATLSSGDITIAKVGF